VDDVDLSVKVALGISMKAALIAMALWLTSTPAGSPQVCTYPCGHRLHQFDAVQCSHPCYGPYGTFPCHPAGDAIPCGHPVHQFDYGPCQR
jgi:hypothetical protein